MNLGTLVTTLGADLGPLNRSVSQAEGQFKRYQDSAEKATKRASSSITSLASKTVATLGSIFAAYKMTSFIKDSAMAYARFETMGIVMENVGKISGYTAEQVNYLDKQIRKTGISMNESRTIITRMIQAQLDLNQATKLARTAQDAAVIGNINSSEAFERMMHGIISGDILILRNIGIQVQFEKAYQKAADAIGKTTEELTEQERVQVRANEVLKAGEKIAGTYEAAMSSAGKQITSFTRYIQDFQVEFGDALGPATTQIIAEATKQMKEFIKVIQQPDVQRSISGIGTTAINTFNNIIKLGGEVAQLFKTVLDGWNQLPPFIQQVGIVGAILFGPKGFAALAAASGAIDIVARWSKALAAIEEGLLTINQLATMNGTELDNYLAKVVDSSSLENNLERLMTKRQAILKRGYDYDIPGMPAPEKTYNQYKKELDALDQQIAMLQKVVKLNKEKTEVSNKTVKLPPPPKSIEENGISSDLKKEWTSTFKDLNLEIAAFTTYGADGMSSFETAVVNLDKKVLDLKDKFGQIPGALEAIDKWKDVFGDVLTTEEATRQNKEFMNELEEIYKLREQRIKDLQVLKEREISDQLYEIDLAEVAGKAHYETLDERIRLTEQLIQIKQAYLDTINKDTDLAGWLAEKEAIDQLRQSILMYIADSDKISTSLKKYRNEALDLNSQIASTIINSFNSMEDALVDFVINGKASFKDLVNSILADLTRIAVKKGITSYLAEGLGSLLGGTSGAVASGWAHGGAFSGGKVLPFAKGGVLTKPIIFPMANGMGLAGEEGPEGVLPLTRINGDLGVKATKGEGEGMTKIDLTIVAADARSFTQMIKKNPEAIIGPFIDQLHKGNRELRTALKKTG